MFGVLFNDSDVKQAIINLSEYGKKNIGEMGELDYKTQLIALQALHTLQDYEKDIDDIRKWRGLAKSYSIDVETMLALAKSQIKTSASNVELLEDISKFIELFSDLPDEPQEKEIDGALIVYDGDPNKPYCDLVYLGVCIIREFYKLHDIVSKYKFSNDRKEGV